jgi:hypothetical protein
MSVEEKLELIRKYKLTKEKIEALEQEYNEIQNNDGDISRHEKLLIQIELTSLKDSLANSLKSEIEFGDKFGDLQEQAAQIFKNLENIGGKGKSDDSGK